VVREVVRILVAAIVDNPDAIVVEERQGRDDWVTVHVRVDPADVGKVIGRQGRVIRAIRTVARAAGARAGCRARVEVES